jgi:hypothetical protein
VLTCPSVSVGVMTVCEMGILVWIEELQSEGEWREPFWHLPTEIQTLGFGQIQNTYLVETSHCS